MILQIKRVLPDVQVDADDGHVRRATGAGPGWKLNFAVVTTVDLDLKLLDVLVSGLGCSRASLNPSRSR